MAVFRPRNEPVGLDDMIEMIDLAHEELIALAEDPRAGRRFRRSIPPQDSDTDIVIGEALRHARAFISDVRDRVRAANEPDDREEFASDALGG